MRRHKITTARTIARSAAIATLAALVLTIPGVAAAGNRSSLCFARPTSDIANGGFEQTCTGQSAPAGWTPVVHGTGGAVLGTTTAAYQGSTAASITVTDGSTEAGWTTPVLAPFGGARYELTFEQSGSTYVYAYVAAQLRDGTTTYATMMAAPATEGQWSQYHDWFQMPAGTQSATLTIATSGTGTVSLDDVAVWPSVRFHSSSFATAHVSISFDDGDAGAVSYATPLLTADHLTATYFLNGSTLNTPGYLTSAQVVALAGAGNEIASHLYHHSDLVQLDPATITSELSGNVAAIQRILGANTAVPGFACPYGSFVSSDIALITRYHAYMRDTDNGLNTAVNLDPTQLHARTVTPTMTPALLQTYLAQAASEHGWLILVFHDVEPAGTTGPTGGEAGYTLTPDEFAADLQTIVASGIPVAPIYPTLRALTSTR